MPNKTGHELTPPLVKNYGRAHASVVPVCALCIFYLLVMVVVLAPAAIAKLPILLREKGTTLILGDISQGQSLPLRPSVSLSAEKKQMREQNVFYYRVMSSAQVGKIN
jgi:hypothetical protein